MMNLIQKLLMNVEALGEGIRRWVNVIYQLGWAAAGSTSSMLIFTGVTLVLFGLCYTVLSGTFLRITTRTQGGRSHTGNGACVLKRKLRPLVADRFGHGVVRICRLRFHKSCDRRMHRRFGCRCSCRLRRRSRCRSRSLAWCRFCRVHCRNRFNLNVFLKSVNECFNNISCLLYTSDAADE